MFDTPDAVYFSECEEKNYDYYYIFEIREFEKMANKRNDTNITTKQPLCPMHRH